MLERFIDHVVNREDIAAEIGCLDAHTAASLEADARGAIAALPVRIGGPADPRELALARVCAEIGYAVRGEVEPLESVLVGDFVRGRDPLLVVQRLVEIGSRDRAMQLARMASANVEVTALIEEIDGFAQLRRDLRVLAEQPTRAGWDAVMDTVRDEHAYEGMKLAVRVLRDAGVDGDFIFSCAVATGGVVPDLLELAESGAVTPALIEERAAVDAIWLGVAAQAAHARGDRMQVLRLLRAMQRRDAPSLSVFVSDIKDAGDDVMNEMIERAGISAEDAPAVAP